MLRSLAQRVLSVRVQQTLKQWIRKEVPASYGYEVIAGEVPTGLLNGWKDETVAKRQHAAFTSLLGAMRAGKPREDFVALATAVQMTGVKDPLIIEVGCGSGWNSEVLTYLLKRPVRHIGLDCSLAMVALGSRCYPNGRFLVGDAMALPLRDATCDILLSGTVLMHLLGYGQAIQESRRVSRRWCIFHTVPVVQRGETALLCKRAYGQPIVEVILNEGELLRLIDQAGLAVRHALDSVPYNLEGVLGEPTLTRTYLCEVIGQCGTST